MQFGFTEKISPIYSALVLQETVLESKVNKLSSYVALLDAKAAFDTVNHELLFRKLFSIGLDSVLWLLVTDIQRNAQTYVRWKNQLSDPIRIQQGVRQGGVLSTDLYKVFINDLLRQSTQSRLGAKIGEELCSSPTCADDVALVANSPENLQALLDIAADYSTNHRYELQPAKSAILSTAKNFYEFKMSDSLIPLVPSAPHLGIQRDNSLVNASLTVTANIKKARRTLYSLLGAGLHGVNGLNPLSAFHLLETYVTPVLTYGLESLLTQTNMEQLEAFYRKILKQILSLPDCVANPAPYILLGAFPIEARIHLQLLSLLRNICMNENNILHDLCVRQVLMKGLEGKRWFSEARRVLSLYDLPSIHTLLNSPPSKYAWKRTTKRAVNKYWSETLVARAKLYPSLSNMATDNLLAGLPHPSVATVTATHTDIRALPVQLRLLTGTYLLQSNRAAFNQHEVNPDCLLCFTYPETRSHFLVCCTALHDIREKYLALLLTTVCRTCSVNLIQVVHDITKLTAFIIDPSQSLQRCCLPDVQIIVRRYLYVLHHRRELMDT